MGRYVINLSSRADDMTQEIILPVTFPGYSQRRQCNELRPHGEIRVTATLSRPNGALSIEVHVRDEGNCMVHKVRYAFPPSQLIHNAPARELPRTK